MELPNEICFIIMDKLDYDDIIKLLDAGVFNYDYLYIYINIRRKSDLYYINSVSCTNKYSGKYLLRMLSKYELSKKYWW